MQEARTVLRSRDELKKKRENAPPRQEDALTSMAQARRALEEQLAKAEEEATKPENALAGLKELQEETDAQFIRFMWANPHLVIEVAAEAGWTVTSPASGQ